MSKLVRLQTFQDRLEADMAKSVLEANGIEASISEDDAGGMHPELGFGTGGAGLFVLEDNLEKAKKVLEDTTGGD